MKIFTLRSVSRGDGVPTRPHKIAEHGDMNGTTWIFVLIGCAVVMFSSRRYALLAFVTVLVYVAQTNGVNAFGLRLYSTRFLELAGLIRIITRERSSWPTLTPLDRSVIVAYAYVSIMFVLRDVSGFGTSPEVKMATPLSKLGEMVDVLLTYMSFRCLIRAEDDIIWLLERMVLILIPFVVCLFVERRTGHNPLALFGGIPSVWVDLEEGRIRCFGSFLHPALLGTFGASFWVVYFGLAISGSKKFLATLGVLLCIIIILLASSGGPLTMMFVGIVGWICWYVRDRMRLVRLCLGSALLIVAAVMKDPIWYIPSKMSIIFGGSGWHRSYLMQQAANNFSEWWIAGMPLEKTLSWFPYLVHGAADITNVYVAFGVDGGLIAMLLLIRLLVNAFSAIGNAVSSLRASSPSAEGRELFLWGFGCAVASHMANFISITYFDQTVSFWLLQLASISVITQSASQNIRNNGGPGCPTRESVVVASSPRSRGV